MKSLGWSVLSFGLLALAPSSASAQVFPVVVNECSTGSSGWIELVNRGTTALDLAKDPAQCWLVDDREGGGSPKAITDANVTHAAGSTTCSSRARGATCGVIASGEFVSVKYAYVNGASGDECRLISAPKVGTLCGTPVRDPGAGGPTTSTSAGQCFGRQPDGAAWALAPISCTQGLPNGACSPGAACDDGNPCTSGGTFSAACVCQGSTPTTGTSCGGGRTCQAGTCAPSASAAPPVIVKTGTEGLILAGTVVTPDTVLEGEVLIVGDEIRCVASSCGTEPAAAAATIVQTNGIIYPGLIDTHNHIQFDIFDESDWAPESTDDFQDHDDWPRKARYKAMVDAKQYLNGEGTPVKIGCELVKYGELKGLIAGTTSIVSAAIQPDQLCFGSLARTIDQRPNGLPTDRVQTATPFPSRAIADGVCANLAPGSKTDAYLIHIAEGVNGTAYNEFPKLFDISTSKGCLYSPKTTIVHGTALTESDFDIMADHGMSLVWSPRSNVFL